MGVEKGLKYTEKSLNTNWQSESGMETQTALGEGKRPEEDGLFRQSNIRGAPRRAEGKRELQAFEIADGLGTVN